MEAPTLAVAVNILASSTTTRRISKISTITPHRFSPRNNSTFLIRCSTRPEIESNNSTDSNPTFETNSNPITTQNLPSPTPTSSFSTSRGLVFNLGSNSSWDSQEVGSPVVKRFISDEEERWFMWYHGRSSNGTSDSIGLALSNNGVHWERGTRPVQSSVEAGLVFNCSQDWWGFDTESIRPAEVVIMSSNKVKGSSAVYWLYYTGYNSEKTEGFDSVSSKYPFVKNPDRIHGGEKVSDVVMSLPGLAISQDGRHWARIEGEHHTGALFDVGAETEWDSLFIASPHVVFHSRGDLRMYYHSFDVKSGQFCIGIARSRDGMRWVKLGKILGGGSVGCFDELGVKNPHVVKNQKSGNYVMVYEGVAKDGKRSIGLAVSSNGLKNWRKCGEEAILKCSVEEDGWDNEGVGSPCLVQMDGKDGEWRLYYRGVGKEGKTGIGMAVFVGAEISNFTRWEGFHL